MHVDRAGAEDVLANAEHTSWICLRLRGSLTDPDTLAAMHFGGYLCMIFIWFTSNGAIHLSARVGDRAAVNLTACASKRLLIKVRDETPADQAPAD